MFQRAICIGGHLTCRGLHTTSVLTLPILTYNQPLTSDTLPRPAGICSMMRLPVQETTTGLDACFIGVPLDIGVTYKSGTNMGPRYIRIESGTLEAVNASTGAAPFESLQVADVGDVRVNQYNVVAACEDIRRHFSKLECIPLTLGGDHTISYPILQAMKEKHGPVALIQFDAHLDTMDTINGIRICHATPFRRALEDGCIIPEKTFQIGIRGPGMAKDDSKWGSDKGFRVYRADDCWHKSLTCIMDEVRGFIGDTPCYVTFDIDALDPAFAPGTGTREIGGLTTIQAQQAIRGCRGLNIVGWDLVEVSPPYDKNNLTSLTAAQLLYEMLCVLPRVKYYPL